MKRRILKKSEVLREGYVKGLKKAKMIIESMIGGGNVINITNIEWDVDDSTVLDEDLPHSIVVNLSDKDYTEIVENGNDDLLVDLVSDYYNFCIKSLEYDLDVPSDTYLHDVDLDSEQQEDELDWGEIQSSIGSEVHDELVGRDYYDIYELRESGQLQEIIDNVESIIREEYNIPVDIDIEDDIMNHIEEQV